MPRRLALLAILLQLAAFVAWRRDRRIGSGFMNRRVAPVLIRHGLAGRGRSELGTIEHVGRRSGVRRLTPIHPVVTSDGMRVVVPLAERSEWAQNVLAADRCRIELHGVIHELDHPRLVLPRWVPDLPGPVRWVGTALDTRYLLLHEVGQQAGHLTAA